MAQRRLAAIDIGTNSIRCIIVEVDEKTGFRVLDDEKSTVRLGEGLTETGLISVAAWERAREALLRMRKITDGLGVSFIESVATSAVRKADNGPAFVAAMKEDTGVDIRVIDGEEEAELAALSARHHFDMANTRFGLVDIGGGSVEIITATGIHIEEVFSLELGAVFLTENFLNSDPISGKQMAALRKHLRKTLRRELDGQEFALQCLIGSGGTITNIGNMVMARRNEQYDSVHGYEVLHSEIVHLLAVLERKSCKERRDIAGLSPERADIIVAGVAAVDALMHALGTNLLKINERGLREGLIIRSLMKHDLWTIGDELREWRSSLRDFARSCHSDEHHSEQVRRLSVTIFAALEPGYAMGERACQLLEAAALLHDVGYFISYSKHHKHSYHLIRHARLFDFSPREIEIIANIARYHRKSLPKSHHDNYRRLSPQDQELVMKLGGILRLADGLDRRRSQLVDQIKCRLSKQRITIDLVGDEELSVEIYGGYAKGDMIETAFSRKLVIRHNPTHS
ncbi:MAG: Ppx/GppA phosphatase family protein [Desulfuromonadales bacterium]|nr:Ppx/GppA phosphatase family protein [Desulfuromonadales bacterium]